MWKWIKESTNCFQINLKAQKLHHIRIPEFPACHNFLPKRVVKITLICTWSSKEGSNVDDCLDYFCFKMTTRHLEVFEIPAAFKIIVITPSCRFEMRCDWFLCWQICFEKNDCRHASHFWRVCVSQPFITRRVECNTFFSLAPQRF